MTKASRSITVPKAMLARFEEIVGITDAFCDQNLDAEHQELARRMIAALCRKRPSPVASGKPVTWASGINWALGPVNFLSDPSTPPSMTLAEVASAFGVGESTVSAKARNTGNTGNAAREASALANGSTGCTMTTVGVLPSYKQMALASLTFFHLAKALITLKTAK